MNGNVYSKPGATVYTCVDPNTAVNKHAPRSQTISYGAGYPPLDVPKCPTCNAVMVRDPATSDPAANQVTVQAAIDSGILPKPVTP